jgi:hypothetical protein
MRDSRGQFGGFGGCCSANVSEDDGLASVTPTTDGLLLTTDTKGNFLAFDASNGNVLLKEDSGDPIGGGVAPYMVDGRAWVAILSLPDHSNR